VSQLQGQRARPLSLSHALFSHLKSCTACLHEFEGKQKDRHKHFSPETGTLPDCPSTTGKDKEDGGNSPREGENTRQLSKQSHLGDRIVLFYLFWNNKEEND
jgi:hypothetical protein